MKKCYTLAKYPPLYWSLKEETNYIELNMSYSNLSKDLNIDKDRFKKLMDYCFENCDFVSFSDPWSNYLPEAYHPSVAKNTDRFLSLIEKYKFKTLKKVKCPCITDIYEDEKNTENFIIIHIYKCESELKKIILEYTDNLFFEVYEPKFNRYIVNPNLLEDICFIKDNSIFLSTASNYSFCNIYPDSPTQLEFFQKLINKYAYFVQIPNML